MALHRGIQSVIFYYLACTPCSDARHRRKRRKETDLAKLEKEILQGEARGTYNYKHLAASKTNPAWDLEIAVGPSKESKAAAKLRAKKEPLDTASRSSGSTLPTSTKATPILDLDPYIHERQKWASSFQRTYIDSPSMAGTSPRPTDYKRSKTDLQTPVDTLPSRPRPSRLASTPISSAAWPYQPNPQLNDLHPATVTKYRGAEDIDWMLTPPPRARVMRGLSPERPSPSSTFSKVNQSPRIGSTRSHSPRNHHADNVGKSSARNQTGLGLTRSRTKEDARQGGTDAGSSNAVHQSVETSAVDGIHDTATGPHAAQTQIELPFLPFRDRDDDLRRDSSVGFETDDEEVWREGTRGRVRANGKGKEWAGHRELSRRDPRWRWSIDW